MICSDIWHKYHVWYFEIVIRNFTPLGGWNLRQFWNITSGIYAKYHVQIMLLFVYSTTHKRFLIFTCRYFKLSWNTTALSQSNCRNFSCSSINKKHFTRSYKIVTYCIKITDKFTIYTWKIITQKIYRGKRKKLIGIIPRVSKWDCILK